MIMAEQKAPIIIIAEAGVNHNGSLARAKEMVKAAAEAGADYVKFQTFKTENLVTHDARKAEYQIKNTGKEEESQYRMLKALELSEEDHYQIKSYCDSIGIKFLSTPFDLESIEFLHSMGMDLWKIPSGEITNYPYLKKIASFNERVVMSTGMCDENDIRLALEALRDNGQDIGKVTLLHCNTQYPTPMHDVNLKAMNGMRKFTQFVGYSDHTQGVEVAIAAAALGANVIEKHFTLSRRLPGPDHKASLEPGELKYMCSCIRNIEQALGESTKAGTHSELPNREVARKSIVAACGIKKGEIFTESNLTVKRPGTGLSPMIWRGIIGERAKRDFAVDEQIEI